MSSSDAAGERIAALQEEVEALRLQLACHRPPPPWPLVRDLLGLVGRHHGRPRVVHGADQLQAYAAACLARLDVDVTDDTPPHPPLLLPAGPNPGMGPAWSGCWSVPPPSTLVADIWVAHDAQQAPVLALADGGAVLDDYATVAFEVEEAEWVVPGDQV